LIFFAGARSHERIPVAGIKKTGVISEERVIECDDITESALKAVKCITVTGGIVHTALVTGKSI
jgi:hypothetical protein